MKRILYSICIGSLALGFTAWGAQSNDTTNVKTKRAHAGTTNVQATTSNHRGATVSGPGQMRTHRDVTSARVHQRNQLTSQASSTAVVHRNHNPGEFHQQKLSSSNDVHVRNHTAINRERNFSVSRDKKINANRDRNLVVDRGRNVRTNRERNINITVNNNWRTSRFSGQNYAAFRNYHRAYHDRFWWSSHFNTIVFVNGGWYYWNTGYWYPAWGYAPNAYYQYDGPICGRNNLGPDRVIVDVQEQLQRDGYYVGPIDGELGPMTRQAITAFQADHGLAITSAIDEPTLATLGLS